MEINKILFVIPARGGSKGIPGKNIKLLNGKPLIFYSIDVARALTTDENICVSSDDDDIIKAVSTYGLKVPFKRPDYLASDTATTNDVLIHAINFYEAHGKFYDAIILLQPTSPLRTFEQVREAISLFDMKIDMVVSVKESHASNVLCKENNRGFLELCFNKAAIRRQEMEVFYEYNGAIYIINVDRLKKYSLSGLNKIKKYVMDEVSSIDIDTPLDLDLVSYIINKRKLE